MLNFNCGVYTIAAPSGRLYVGSSSNIRKRWSAHRTALAKGDHHCRQLQRACNKHGLDSFVFSKVAICGIDDLLRREQEQMDEFGHKRLYNSSLVAGSIRGFQMSAETRAKQSLAKLGKKATQSTRVKMSTYAKQRSLEHLAKLANASTGKRATPAAKEKMRQAKLGKRQSSEHVEKVRQRTLSAQRRDNSSGVRGVTCVNGRWRARIKLAGCYKQIGTFATCAEAAAAIQAARRADEAANMAGRQPDRCVADGARCPGRRRPPRITDTRA